ncbi:glucoamylase-like protein [Trypanosoma grayi]|uniref:glucoamylase-like protein n=1 Tax=Trypanosoma grayi TaxID=71804 RepID=UPI0004F44F83|nr:glucoamylase-like protein [Trypanosoma grayi]KEG09647.1 glucoamylase-like protein [Trypanosoma grayi]
MSGAVSPAAALRVPRERDTDHCRHRATTLQKHTTIQISPLHHCSQQQQQQQRHHHHYQQPQQPCLPVHNTASAACAAHLLPPHVHSLLYHSIVGPTCDPVASRAQGNATVSVGSPTMATACLRTPYQSRHQQQQQQQQQQRSCNTPASVRINVGCAASAAVTAAGVMPLQASMMIPSPFSENASVGNGSGSPSTTRGWQTTDTKKRPCTSPVVLSPAYSPSNVTGLASTGMVGRALERDLLAAENDELVQILLELSSCNLEAARFIQSKARLFAMRHAISPTNQCGENGDGVSGSESSAVMQQPQPGGSLGILDRCCASTHPTPSKPLAFEDDTPRTTDSCSNRYNSAMRASPLNPHSRSENWTQTLLRTPPNQRVARPRGEAKQSPAFTTAVADTNVRAEERAFCTEVHPCLRWYGSCRHPTSCPFALCPQNLCLNWVRSSCVAGTQCGGVHRLPDACPPEVRTVFDLGHGADRVALAQVQLHHHQQQQATFMGAAVRRPDSPTTPKEQIIVDPVSIPASLEHYQRESQQGEEETLSTDQKDDNYGSACNCRSCRSLTEDEHEHDNEGFQGEQNHHHQQFLPPPPAQPVPRCLNDSFAGAADSSATAAVVCSEEWWPASLSLSRDPRVTVCEGESDEDGVELPPRNACTRTQSPVAS